MTNPDVADQIKQELDKPRMNLKVDWDGIFSYKTLHNTFILIMISTVLFFIYMEAYRLIGNQEADPIIFDLNVTAFILTLMPVAIYSIFRFVDRYIQPDEEIANIIQELIQAENAPPEAENES